MESDNATRAILNRYSYQIPQKEKINVVLRITLYRNAISYVF